jgi:hypothetical protein
MSTESKEKKEGVACCDPKKFKGMFEMMNKCCSGGDIQSDWQDKMEKMMGTCCGPKTEDTKKE